MYCVRSIKKKVSFTIDEDIYEAIAEASRTYKIAKSRLAQEAISLWLKKETEDLMARGYEEMGSEDNETAETAFEAQREIL